MSVLEPRLLKDQLRREIQDRLRSLPEESSLVSTRSIHQRTMDLAEIRSARRVMVCLSFGFEVDTWQLIESLVEQKKEIYVPRAVDHDRSLHVHRFPCTLETLSFGLRQPAPHALEIPTDEVDETIDAALILGIAYDVQGSRLGYGAGYFDRFLANKTFPTIALAYEQQLIDRVPTEAHDISMSIVVTEERLIRPAMKTNEGMKTTE